MVRIYLSRHGQTEWNVEKRMQGQKDSPLTGLGRRQAEALGHLLSDAEIKVIYSSTSLRALETARLVRGTRNIEIITEDGLREICLGSWEGKLFSEVEKLYPTEFDNFWNHPEVYKPAGGETFENLRRRVGAQLELISKKHQGESVFIVTHGIVLKTLYTYFRNQPVKEIIYSPHPKSACFCRVEKEDGIWKIQNWNETDHCQFIPE